MSIFEIRPDLTNYDRLLLALEPIGDDWRRAGFEEWLDVSFAIDGKPMAKRWYRMPVEEAPAPRRRNRGKPVDFLSIDIGCTIVISDRALAVIAPLVSAVIEALALDDITRPARRYFLVNTLDHVDCLDERQSDIERYDNGTIRRIRRFAFRPGTTEGHHLFRVVQEPRGQILASSEFKRLVEENNLVGLEFHAVGE